MPFASLRAMLAPLTLAVALACYFAVIFGQLVALDALRPAFSAYPSYLPGQPQPPTGCEELHGWEHDIYLDTFVCRIDGVDRISAYGYGGRITGTFLVFSDTRIGDAVALLGKPVRVYNYRLYIYVYGEATVYLWRPRRMSFFARLRYLSFSIRTPTAT